MIFLLLLMLILTFKSRGEASVEVAAGSVIEFERDLFIVAKLQRSAFVCSRELCTIACNVAI